MTCSINIRKSLPKGKSSLSRDGEDRTWMHGPRVMGDSYWSSFGMCGIEAQLVTSDFSLDADQIMYLVTRIRPTNNCRQGYQTDDVICMWLTSEGTVHVKIGDLDRTFDGFTPGFMIWLDNALEEL